MTRGKRYRQDKTSLWDFDYYIISPKRTPEAATNNHDEAYRMRDERIVSSNGMHYRVVERSEWA